MKQYLHYIDNLRAIAIIFVVLSHLSVTTPDGGTFLSDLSYFLINNGTLFFVFISGFLFWHLESRDFQYRIYFQRKLKYLLLPYFFLAVPVAIFKTLVTHSYQSYDMTPWGFFFWSLLTGHPAIPPLWYVPMILLIFAASPLWVMILKSRHAVWITGLLLMFSLFSGRPFYDLNPVLSMLHFLGVFVFGGLAAQYQSTYTGFLKSKSSNSLLLLGLTGFLLTGFAYTLNPGKGSEARFVEGLFHPNLIQIGKLLLLFVIVTVVVRWYDKPIPWLSAIASRSFAIFFLHGLVMITLRRLGVFPMLHKLPVLLAGCIEFVLLFGLSLLITECCKRLFKGRSRYMIGY